MKVRLAIVESHIEDEYRNDLNFIEQNLCATENKGILANKITNKFKDRCWYKKPYQYKSVVVLNTEELNKHEYVILLDEIINFLYDLNISGGNYILLDCLKGTFYDLEKVHNDPDWKKWIQKNHQRMNKNWWQFW